MCMDIMYIGVGGGCVYVSVSFYIRTYRNMYIDELQSNLSVMQSLYVH